MRKLKSLGFCLAVAILAVIPLKIAQVHEIASQELNLTVSESRSSLLLYGGERTRAAAVVWYLEELGISYQYKKLDISTGENKKPEYLAINPMGKVPALVDGDFSIWESGAILWYLAAKYGQMPSDLTKQGPTIQWILFANSTLANGLFLEDRREQEMPRLLTPLNEIFQENSYLMCKRCHQFLILFHSHQ